MFQERGYLAQKEYNWLKRLVAYALSFLILFGVHQFYPLNLIHWAILLAVVMSIILWYGSQVRIDSIFIGIRYGLFYFSLIFSVLLNTRAYSHWMWLIALSFLVLSLITSWSLPRVKLGLRVVKPLGAIKSSIALVLVGYNVLAYFLISDHWILNLISSLSVLAGFILLYSTYSYKLIIHFILISYLFVLVLAHYLLTQEIIWKQPLLILVLYIIFIVIQFNAKPFKKKEK